MQNLLVAAHDTAAASASQVRAIEAQERVMREQAKTMAANLHLTKRVADAAQASADAATTHALATKRQLRAYVFTVSGDIRWGVRGDSSVTIVVRNFGLTPAYSVEIYTIFDTVEVEKGIIFPDFESRENRKIGVIAPRGQFRYTQEAEKTLSLLYREGEGSKMILVWGEIRYKDTFGDAQWSRYCLRTIGPNENEMEPSEVGNDAS
jgi:hypothetical protein